MWADTDTDVDYLNYSEVAELVAEMVGSERLLPLSLGVFGTWGTGKSTVLRLVKRELQNTPTKYLFIDFDAWLYQDFDDARGALMSVIAKALADEAPEGLQAKAKSFLGRVNKLRALGLLAEGGAAFAGFPAFGMLRKGVEGVGDLLSGTADDEDYEAMGKAAGEVKDKGKGLLRQATKVSPPEEITAFRKEFEVLLKGIDKTLVVVIDNLDRCTPPNAIHTLEAIRLFLFLPRTAFVVAADEDMVRHAVSSYFKNPSERLVQDYLDKLIQVPVRVPRLGVQEVRAYMLLLFAEAAGIEGEKMEALRSYLIDQLRQVWKPDANFSIEQVVAVLDMADPEPLRRTLDLADRMAPLLAYSANVKGNPRIIKRLLNIVRMRASIARKRAMPIDEAIIAKLALFERCTSVSAVDALHDAINAGNGKPELLAKIEAMDPNDADFEQALPQSMRTHLTFLRDWVGLDPKLGGYDLRPAVYLARETVPVRTVATLLSPAALAAVEVLRAIRTVSSPAARDALALVDQSEHVPMMDALVRDMRRNSEWMRSRDDFRGAVYLADASAGAGSTLSRFIRSLDLPRRPPWMSTMLNGKPWAEV
ncbi:P-loop NTPase fold protein [Methylobacterium sp. E-016]|uniref:KAP family P-loop NTPase fold protein n=1 Tax=Methylobacterium sp. E-016 TaxID=2836556 RepID=UPI001FB90521|nr:P-loop NTPase fold protein [Methylobacterium sp. E-016]MCJ2077666.1 P-loop NTPase fold protein [Methylobacterium sp. E-016]